MTSNNAPVILVKDSVKENPDIAAADSSNPSLPATQATASLTRSRGFVINDVKNPLIAPSRPPRIPPSAYPSIAPLIVSNNVIIITNGAKILPTTPATLATVAPNVFKYPPIELNILLICPAGPESIPLIVLVASTKGFASALILSPTLVNALNNAFSLASAEILAPISTKKVLIVVMNALIEVPIEATLDFKLDFSFERSGPRALNNASAALI